MHSKSFAKNKIKFLLLENIHSCAAQTLNSAGYSNVEEYKRALSVSELTKRLQDVRFLGIRSCTQIDSEILDAAPHLMGVGCFCIGTNQVDLKALTERGIIVFNAPYSNTRSVAELVMGEAVLLCRNIPEKNAQMHRGVWHKSAARAHEVRGKTLGIVGYGNIGRQLGILAESFGMRVLFFDSVSQLPLGRARAVASLPELLAQVDILTLHVPQNRTTEWLIGAKEIAQMPKGALLINASRGTVVDLDALDVALRSEHLRGAAIDVFPQEPKVNKASFYSSLQKHDNIILTPHIGGSTFEAQKNIGIEVAEKLIQYADVGSSMHSVNFPEVSLPQQASAHRILHIHQNIPGILSAINGVFSAHKINVLGQYLRTNEKIGYVVTDIEAEKNKNLLVHLKNINGTLKCRVLH